jgi:hypothetical protein
VFTQRDPYRYPHPRVPSTSEGEGA